MEVIQKTSSPTGGFATRYSSIAGYPRVDYELNLVIAWLQNFETIAASSVGNLERSHSHPFRLHGLLPVSH